MYEVYNTHYLSKKFLHINVAHLFHFTFFHLYSAELKSKLKTCLLLNLLLALLQGALLLCSYLEVIQVEPLPWQYMWLASFISSLIGLMALPRNRQMYLRLSNAGTVTLGMGGILYGTLHHFEALKIFLATGKS